MTIGEDYNPELWHFDWNQQKATVHCICGEVVDVMSEGPSTCTCGRMYWLETIMKIDWAYKGNDPEQLLG